MRPRSVEPLRSPLLKRVQSAEKLTGDKTGLGGYHGDKKGYSTRCYNMEMPLSEGEGLEDEVGDSTTRFVCVGEHGRQRLFIGMQKDHQGSTSGGSSYHHAPSPPQHRPDSHHSKEIMRKLAPSERRDSFKKQEAVHELCFNVEEEEEMQSPHLSFTQPKMFRVSPVNPSQSESTENLGGSGASQQKAKSKGKIVFS